MNARRTLLHFCGLKKFVSYSGDLSPILYFDLHFHKKFSTSSLLEKVHHKFKKTPLTSVLEPTDDDPLLKAAYNELEKLKKQLIEEFNSHFSLKTDLRVYENCYVTLPNGETHKMNRLGRISMKNSEQIIINFEDNPATIKAAKTALLKSAVCTNPQQEGAILYINVPKSSRELREQISANAKKILNDYKDALNKHFRKYSTKNETNKNADERQKKKQSLLQLKKNYELDGETLMKEKQNSLMKEIA